jgi:hypothetical protein
LGTVRTGMDQRDAELGAHQGQVVGAVIGPIAELLTCSL